MDTALLAGALAALGGIGVLRWSWAGKERSLTANLVGWGLLLAGCVMGGAAAGAWGVAVVSLSPMVLAMLLLGWAAATSPRGKGKATSRRAHALPETGEPLRLGGRLLTFVLVVVAGFAAAVALSIGARAGALALGWTEADANAAALMMVPLAWGVLATLLLMTPSRRHQAVALVATSLPLVPALFAGS